MVSTQYILDIITIHTKNSKEMRSFISSRLVAKAEPDPIFFFFELFAEMSHYSRAKNILN